jgi:hypothetical protein
MAFRCAYCKQTHTGPCAAYQRVAAAENRADAARQQGILAGLFSGCLMSLLTLPFTVLGAQQRARRFTTSTPTTPTAGGQHA